MHAINMPGFTAEAAMRSRSAVGLMKTGGLGYWCFGKLCVCAGQDDCLDMFINECGPNADFTCLPFILICGCTR